MSGGEPEPPKGGGGGKAKGGGKGKLLAVIGMAVVLLGGGGAGAAWFLKLGPFAKKAEAEGEHAAGAAAAPALPPVFVEVPDIVANLNASGRRPVYVKLRARLEVSRQQDAAAAQAAMPRLLDMFNTFLRETRPEELRGSAGAHRLREEMIARANIAMREGSVIDVLFVEMVIQ